MYYIIQRYYDDPNRHFIAYKVPKVIAVKENENIIVEFVIDGQKKRKWIPKKDIVLLTKERSLYEKLVSKLLQLESQHKEQIQKAQEELERFIESYKTQMHSEFDAIATEHTKNQ